MIDPSVCPSVKRVNCDKTKKSYYHILIPQERSMHLFLRHEEWLVGMFPPQGRIQGGFVGFGRTPSQSRDRNAREK